MKERKEYLDFVLGSIKSHTGQAKIRSQPVQYPKLADVQTKNKMIKEQIMRDDTSKTDMEFLKQR